MSDKITVTNIAGAIGELAIPVDPEGGITVIKGFNGAGKDSALAAVARATGGSGPLECSDGHATGSVDCFGARLTVARSTRLSGQLEATGLSGRLDLSRLVEPPFVDPTVADAHRIKALCTLRGIEAKPKMFWPLFGGQERFETAVTLNGKADLVEMARLIKVAAEGVARDKEAKAERAEGQATACAGASSGLDMTAEGDADALQALFEGEIAKEAAVKASAKAAREALAAAAEAEEAIAARKDSHKGPSVAEANEEVESATGEALTASREVESLRQQLAKAEVREDAMDARALTAGRAYQAAMEHASTIAAWRRTIDASQDVVPASEAVLSQVAADVTTAREAVETGALVRDAKEKAKEALGLRLKAVTLRTDAEALREAGRATDSVLSEAVDSDSLWVEGGRLMFRHRRGDVCFHVLSKGERWKIALDEAIKRIRELRAEGTALIIIPQHAWEGLDPDNRRDVWEYARELKVTILAGQCTRGELRAVIYHPDTEPAGTAV